MPMGSTQRYAVRTVPAAAQIGTRVGVLTGWVAMVKVVDCVNGTTVTWDGTVATAGFPLVIPTPATCSGAPERVTVPVAGAPPTTAVGFTVREYRPAMTWISWIKLDPPKLAQSWTIAVMLGTAE